MPAETPGSSSRSEPLAAVGAARRATGHRELHAAVGKSTVAAANAEHRAYCQPDSLILAPAPSGRQSGEFLRTFAATAETQISDRVPPLQWFGYGTTRCQARI